MNNPFFQYTEATEGQARSILRGSIQDILRMYEYQVLNNMIIIFTSKEIRFTYKLSD